MKRFIERLAAWSSIVLLLLCLALAWAANRLHDQAQAARTELFALQQQIKQQNDQAAQTLKNLTAQRDAQKARADAAFDRQEASDAANQQEIARLADELERRPVRVRIITQPATSGASSDRADSRAAAIAKPGGADPAQTLGVLPERNSQRLAGLITEIETINAAYTSCRSRLFFDAP